MMTMLYFSYGSNLSSKRLLARVPSARKVACGWLAGHQLRFHKKSELDGSAKCDAFETGNPADRVHGVVFRIDRSEKPILDEKEGLGYGYAQKQVEICQNNGDRIQTFTYYALLINDQLQPFDWYLEHVIHGAREHDLPTNYVNRLKQITAVPDPDIRRRNQELAIYR